MPRTLTRGIVFGVSLMQQRTDNANFFVGRDSFSAGNKRRARFVQEQMAMSPLTRRLTRAESVISHDQRAMDANIKSLKFNQDQAAKGDAYGQFRMGERYMVGDGVEK